METKKLLKFSKSNCLPCEQVTQWLDRNEIMYEEINPFDNPELAGKYKVRTVPSLLLIVDDEIKVRLTGFNPDELQVHLLEFSMIK